MAASVLTLHASLPLPAPRSAHAGTSAMASTLSRVLHGARAAGMGWDGAPPWRLARPSERRAPLARPV